ncbi:MAG TPA: 50S ribosomal protein L1 [Chthonomonadales bacterium]|nr:50S ribosomal protein L1 [Chthonomonadales bacterium]
MPGPKLSTRQRREARAGRPKHGKRYMELVKKVNPQELLSPDEALAKVKELATAKFDETIEVAVKLGVDPRHGDQMVRGTVNLPYGTGKSRKVAVFAKGEQADAAREAGADEVGAEDLIEKIQKGWSGWTEFDLFVATPDMMPQVGRLGSILKQKMPNPKAGTVSQNVAQVVKDIKGATRAEYRVEKAGIIHAPIGKASFPLEHLRANYLTMLNALIKAKPQAAKGRYLQKINICSTMGPSVNVDTMQTQKLAERI